MSVTVASRDTEVGVARRDVRDDARVTRAMRQRRLWRHWPLRRRDVYTAQARDYPVLPVNYNVAKEQTPRSTACNWHVENIENDNEKGNYQSRWTSLFSCLVYVKWVHRAAYLNLWKSFD